MERSSTFSYFSRVLVTLLTINLLTIGTLVLIAYTFSADSLRHQAEDHLLQTVGQISTNFSQDFGDNLAMLLQDIEDSPSMDEYLRVSREQRLVIARRLEQRFTQLARRNPAIAGIYFADDRGRIRFGMRQGRRLLEQVDLATQAADDPWHHAAAVYQQLKAIPLLLESGNLEWFMPPRELQVEGPYRAADGRLSLLLGRAKLDKDIGQFGGALLLEVQLEPWLQDMSENHFLGHNLVWVLSADGQAVLQRPETTEALLDPRPFVHADAQITPRLVSNDQGLIIYQPLYLTPLAGQPLMMVATSVPSGLLLKDLAPALRFYSLVALLSVIVVVLVSVLFSRFLARPVNELAEAKNRLANAQRLARLGHWEYIDGDVIRLSEQAAAILKLPPDKTTLALKDFIHYARPRQRSALRALLQQAMTQGLPGSIDYEIKGPQREVIFVHQEVDVIDAHPRRVVATIQDISELKRAEQRIRQLAYYDTVTGLANRTLMGELVQHAIDDAKREHHRMALIFLDLDQFKTINDTLGHDAGDELLRIVAHRLQQSVRPSDTVTAASTLTGQEQAVARLGGDEFIILLPALMQAGDAALVAARILKSLNAPYQLSGKEVHLSGSLGISIYPEDGATLDILLKHADAAMYQAKSLGKNRFEFYSASIDQRLHRRAELELSLHQALEREEFVLHYQPRVDLHSRRITSVECLIRWDKPGEGLIGPDLFICIAEETGLIVPMGEWVLRTACAQLRQWRDVDGLDITLSVNLSPVQFSAENLLHDIRQILANSGVSPRHVELELTENALFSDVESSVAIAQQLKSLGFSLSIDDFGTGYSSLKLLKSFPVDALKIDRSFVANIPQDAENSLIVETSVRLAHSLGLKVVAEGVESLEQLNLLQGMGCDQAQGYYCSRPVSAAALTEMLHRQQQLCMEEP